jgi:hypothetical protein
MAIFRQPADSDTFVTYDRTLLGLEFSAEMQLCYRQNRSFWPR